MLGWLAVGRRSVRKGRWLQNRIVHNATIRRGLRGRWADSAGAVTPNVFELGGRHVRTVVGSNGGPELLTTGLVDGTEAVGVDNLGLVSHLGVDAQGIVWLGRSARSQSARLRK